MRTTIGYPASGYVEPAAAFAFTNFGGLAHADTSSPSENPRVGSFTPTGIPKGIVIMVSVALDAGVNPVTGVTYGGVSCTQTALSPFSFTVESNTFHLSAWTLLSGIPTGTQTFGVNLTGLTGYQACNAVCYAMVGPNNTAVEDTSTANTTGANPTCALTIANESFVVATLVSGHDTTASITAGTGMTLVGSGQDFGSQVLRQSYKTALISANTSVTFAAVSQEYGILAVAIRST